MTAPNLFTDLPGPDPATMPGPDLTADDQARLTTQLERIERLMSDHCWRTVDEIVAVTGDPAPSVQAQLRHLRKVEFGSYVVDRRHRGDPSDGLYEYMVGDKGAGQPVHRQVLPDDTVRTALAAADDLIGHLQHRVFCAALRDAKARCDCGFVDVRRAWVLARTATRQAGL